MDLLRARAAVLAREQVDHGRARAAGAKAGLAQSLLGVLAPASNGSHAEDDSRSHRRATVARLKTRIVLTLTLAAALAGCGGGSGAERTHRRRVLLSARLRRGGDRRRGLDVAQPDPARRRAARPRALRQRRPHDRGRRPRPLPRRGLPAGARGRDRRDVGARRRPPRRARPAGGESGRDPHVWLDPLRYAAIAERIGEELDRRPEAERVRGEAARARPRVPRAASPDCERDEIVTSHAAFGYLAERYGLEQVAITGIAPEAEPTPRDLERRRATQVRAAGATTVFFEPLVSPRLAETVAREAARRPRCSIRSRG